MVFFNKALMNGANLFGVSLTLIGLFFALPEMGNNRLVLLFSGLLYLVASAFAFMNPKLSE
jgi:hypothetical protein